jgi:predicted transglutaminase-like cysteine proteinase
MVAACHRRVGVMTRWVVVALALLAASCAAPAPPPTPLPPPVVITAPAPAYDDSVPHGPIMRDGSQVLGPAGYYDYCRRHMEDIGCSR